MITLATWNPPTLCENFTSHKWLHLLKSWLLGKFLFRFHRFLAVYPHVDRSSRTVKPTASLSWSVPIIQHTDLRLALWSILELKKEPRHWCPRYPKLLQHETVPCVEFWGVVICCNVGSRCDGPIVKWLSQKKNAFLERCTTEFPPFKVERAWETHHHWNKHPHSQPRYNRSSSGLVSSKFAPPGGID